MILIWSMDFREKIFLSHFLTYGQAIQTTRISLKNLEKTITARNSLKLTLVLREMFEKLSFVY